MSRRLRAGPKDERRADLEPNWLIQGDPLSRGCAHTHAQAPNQKQTRGHKVRRVRTVCMHGGWAIKSCPCQSSDDRPMAIGSSQQARSLRIRIFPMRQAPHASVWRYCLGEFGRRDEMGNHEDQRCSAVALLGQSGPKHPRTSDTRAPSHRCNSRCRPMRDFGRRARRSPPGSRSS